MAFLGAQVAIATTASQIAPLPATPNASPRPRLDPMHIVLTTGSAAIALGGPGVTFANGLPVAASTTIQLDITSTDVLYGIASGAPTTISVLLSRQ